MAYINFAASLNGQSYQAQERNVNGKNQLAFIAGGYSKDPVPRVSCIGDGSSSIECTTDSGTKVNLNNCQTTTDPTTGNASVTWCDLENNARVNLAPVLAPVAAGYKSDWGSSIVSFLLIILLLIIVFYFLMVIYYSWKKGKMLNI